MIITPNQIKAARALIEWSQSDLGERTGLSQGAIANFETGRHRPNDSTAATVHAAFDRAGVEFIDGGVRLRPDGMEVISGDDFTTRMLTFYLDILQRSGAKEVLITGVDSHLFNDATHKAVGVTINTLQALGKSQRVLVRSGTDAKDIVGPLPWHRMIPDHLFSSQTASFVFENYFALMLLDRKQVIVIRNANLADYQRKQFDFLWNIAEPFDK